MSKYLSQFMPEQLMSFMSKIKEATIDVGPQPVKFAKFSTISLKELLLMISYDNGQAVAEVEAIKRIGISEEAFKSNQEINCLLVATEIALEIWLVN